MQGPWREYKAHSDTEGSPGDGGTCPSSIFKPTYTLGVPWYWVAISIFLLLSTCRGGI